MKRFFLFLLLLLPAFAFSQQLNGLWYGVVDLPSARMGVHIYLTPAKSGYASRVYGLWLGSNRIEVKNVLVEGDSVEIKAKGRGMTFKGRLITPDSICGEASHNENVMPVSFKRVPRPQTPQQPFRYREQEVFFPGGSDSVRLAGTFTLPHYGGKHPAVLLLSSGGPQNRNNEMSGHEPNRLLADRLTRKGYAVLRYDDRGVSHSTGNYATATVPDLYADARSACVWLSEQGQVDANRIYIIGHSEGGLLASMLASDMPEVAGVVLLSVPAIPIKELLLHQRRTLMSLQGVPEELITVNEELNRQLYTWAADTIDNDTLKAMITEHMTQFYQERYDDMIESDIEAGCRRTVSLVVNNWFRSFVRLVPEEYISEIKCPVLAVYGNKDLMVDAHRNADALMNRFPSAEVHRLPGLNHLLQPARGERGTADYIHIPITMDEQVLELILRHLEDWSKRERTP